MAADMAVCRWQTVEDGAPRDTPPTLSMWEQGVEIQKQYALSVRHPLTQAEFPRYLMVTARQDTGEITAALAVYSQDDGA
jgi:hypothetical protein